MAFFTESFDIVAQKHDATSDGDDGVLHILQGLDNFILKGAEAYWPHLLEDFAAGEFFFAGELVALLYEAIGIDKGAL